MSDKSLRQFSEDIEQRRQALRQRSADAVQSYKQKSAASSEIIAKRRAEMSQKAKQAIADMIAKRKSAEQQGQMLKQHRKKSKI